MVDTPVGLLIADSVTTPNTQPQQAIRTSILLIYLECFNHVVRMIFKVFFQLEICLLLFVIKHK